MYIVLYIRSYVCICIRNTVQVYNFNYHLPTTINNTHMYVLILINSWQGKLDKWIDLST